jgi:hypothetical protein
VIEQSEHPETLAEYDERGISVGAPRSHISRAVDIIAAKHRVSGTSAFAIITQASKGSQMSVADFATVVVSAHEASKRDTT